MTNFGPEPVDTPSGEILLSSERLVAGVLPADTTVWFRA
jgi:hypothetical protein